MSETTRKLRKFGEGCEGHKLIDWYHMYLGMELAADAIEAVEAQVAEAVARVAALEKTRPASPAAPVRRFKVGDRVRFVAEPKWVKGYLGALGTIERIPGEATLAYYIASDVRGTNGGHVSADDADLEPAPSAVTAPRGFRKGDVVRHCNYPGEDWTVDAVAGFAVDCVAPKRDDGRFLASSEFLTLVRAADAPEAPAEDAGLVERLARIIVDTPCAANHEGQCIPPGAPVDDCDRANARAVLSDLTAESRLCAPGEVARLKDELAEANGARFLNANAVRLQKARAEAAEKELAEARAISAATAERVRNETQIATELRHDLADANDRLTSQSRSIEEMHAELAEAHKWRDDLRAKLAAAESDRDAAFSKETALRRDLLAWQDAATEARNERDEFKRRLSAADREQERLRAELDAAQGEMRSLRVTISVLRADLAALKDQRDAQTRSYNWVSAECGALRLASLTWFNEKGEPELLATAEEVTERRKAAAKELAALKAKPRSRTRKVTLDDAIRANTLCASYVASGSSAPLLDALTYLGFRRRVDGAK